MRLILEKIKKPRANSPTTLGINILKTYKLTNKLIWGSLFVENVNVIYKLHRNKRTEIKNRKTQVKIKKKLGSQDLGF